LVIGRRVTPDSEKLEIYKMLHRDGNLDGSFGRILPVEVNTGSFDVRI